jgi:hypothetical protein
MKRWRVVAVLVVALVAALAACERVVDLTPDATAAPDAVTTTDAENDGPPGTDAGGGLPPDAMPDAQ